MKKFQFSDSKSFRLPDFFLQGTVLNLDSEMQKKQNHWNKRNAFENNFGKRFQRDWTKWMFEKACLQIDSNKSIDSAKLSKEGLNKDSILTF